ncbi:ORF73 peptide [Hyphantria cunea nucleopolyhedrovirus]|uniref:ORF73 peptide n=1 Tax=Hyphantria cunea nuclear polyhedrosis virus TaxID=28288 RepID=Q2NNZ9_NPVHC|nr:ORF73 peptide [Hyphantria cunea nucleopolyhedrovirus]BAE72362.1 ORF73 peptide [Hyphantria cunea nucleopolyhedrovirus]
MNLDVPYYRLGNHERVEYIPLKLALNDDAPPDNSHEYADSMEHKMDGEMQTRANQMSTGLIMFISLIAFVALFLLLYVIYYFVILREQPQYSNDIDNDPSFLFNKFD